MNINPKIFLRIGGSFLITIGILGLIGFLNQISEAAFFHPPYWIHFVHLGLGITIFSVSFTKLKKLQTILTAGAAITGILLGLLGLLLGGYFADKYNIPELRDPSDHIAHLIVGLTALWAFRKRELPIPIYYLRTICGKHIRPRGSLLVLQ